MCKTRLFPYDLVRVIALIMVICVHSLPDSYWAWAVGQPLFYACNGIFFMLSGHFNLHVREEGTLGRYYLRKVATIMLPVLVYTGIIVVWETKHLLPNYPQAVLGRFAEDFIHANSLSHLWFVYTLFGILLAAPFFARMLQAMNDGEKRWFVGLGMGYFACLFLLSFTRYDLGWDYPFGFACFMFLVEPICHPYLQRCPTRALLAGVVVPLGVLAYLCTYGYGSYLFDMNPLYVTEVFCLYELFLRLGGLVGSDKLITLMAKHQYGMYIMHMFCLLRVKAYVVPRIPEGLPWQLSWLLVIASTLLLALVIATTVDIVVIKPLQQLLYRVVEAIGRSRGKVASASE